MAAIDDIVNQWNGKGLDTDGFPPSQRYQCYDVFIQYGRMISGNGAWYFSASLTGLAQDIWNQYGSSAILQQLFTQVAWNQQGEKGDVAIWGRTSNTPDSHVALVLQDKGTVQNIFGQNQPYPYCTIRDFPSNGLLGYLRPRSGQVQINNQGNDDMITGDVLNALYNDLLGRAPDQGAIDHYVGKYSTNFVVGDLRSSAEFSQRQALIANEKSTLQAQITDLQSQLVSDNDVINKLNEQVSTLSKQNETITATLKDKIPAAVVQNKDVNSYTVGELVSAVWNKFKGVK